MQVLRKVTEPTNWISSAVVLRKSTKLRLYIDPKDLHYPILAIEILLPEVSEDKVFSEADAKNGFWQVKVDEPSSFLTTF